MDQDLIEDFALLQVQDDDWNTLYAKILDERKQKNLTITDFLLSCGLNPNRSYFKQLCCKTTKRLHPSKRRNSPGREFRDAVAKYFADNVTPTISNQSLETVISEWCLDNRLQLRESRISDIRLVDPNLTDLVVYAYKECALSDSDILNMLMVDLSARGLRIASRYESQLLALTSPVCVKAGESLGTATLVNVKGCVVALTCAHVLCQMFGKKVTFCERDIPTNKFKLEATGSFFGYGFSNDDMDIAGVLPVAHLPLLVNEVEENAVPVKLTKWWKDDEPLKSKIDYLTKSTVTKCGISSRTTTGEVQNVGGNFFIVKGNEVTPFSVPGDSGSLVLNNVGEILGIVTEIAQFEQHGNSYVTEVLPVWEFYDWLDELRDFEAK